MQKKIINTLFLLSFIFYVTFLLWNIIFKYVSPMELFTYGRFFSRNINLIPFNDIIHGYYNSFDIFWNVILFIPLGIYVNMFFKSFKTIKGITIIFIISLLFELLQYILALGFSDVTDLITNTLGGTIGIGLYLLIKRRLEDHKKIKMFITICSTLTMILVTGILLILFVVNN